MPGKRSNRDEQQDRFDRRTPVPGEEAGETESELTMLLDQTIAELTEGMSEEEAAAYIALEVYLGTREHPLELPQALKHIRLLSESTILTARIVLGLWNMRRNNA